MWLWLRTLAWWSISLSRTVILQTLSAMLLPITYTGNSRHKQPWQETGGGDGRTGGDTLHDWNEWKHQACLQEVQHQSSYNGRTLNSRSKIYYLFVSNPMKYIVSLAAHAARSTLGTLDGDWSQETGAKTERTLDGDWSQDLEQELLVKEALHIQMTPLEERFNSDGWLEVPGCWSDVMRKQGGSRTNPRWLLTSIDMYPQ